MKEVYFCITDTETGEVQVLRGKLEEYTIEAGLEPSVYMPTGRVKTKVRAVFTLESNEISKEETKSRFNLIDLE